MSKDAMSKESKVYVVLFALGLCLVFSVIVSTAAVALKATQQANALADQRRNVLEVAGMYQRGMDIEAAFQAIEARVILFETGEYVDHIDPTAFNQYKAARETGQNIPLARREDIAGLGAISRHGVVYLLRDDDGNISHFILPVHGYGLWSTMYGYVALEADGNTISGITFHDHAETPGLGGEIDNARWKAQWQGKQVYGEDGQVKFRSAKSASGDHEVDALAGATLTSNGVTNMMRFWMSEQGYKPFLDRVAQRS
jgi:Na+-transporting NADH:ubiquinone oxidoreductase subunit C